MGDDQRGERQRRRGCRRAPRGRWCGCGRRARRAVRRAAAPAGRVRARGRPRRAGARRRSAARASRARGGRCAGARAVRARAHCSRRRRPRWPRRSCAGTARTPGRRGRPSGGRARGRSCARCPATRRRRARSVRARPLQAGDVAQDRGLARAARADQRERLGVDGQAGAELERAKGVGEVEPSGATKGACTEAGRRR